MNCFPNHLQAWDIDKSPSSTKRLCQKDGFKITIESKEVKWPVIFNMFTGAFLNNSFQLTSLFYLGYLKKKNETAEKNATSALFKKILGMEEERSKQNQFLGKDDTDPATIQTHKFSPYWVKFLCR